MIFQLERPNSSSWEENDAEKELKYLLQYNSYEFDGNNGHYSLRFRDDDKVWTTEFEVIEEKILIWGIYPFEMRDLKKGMDFCNSSNLQTVMGAFSVYKAHLTYRTSADLFDAYSSYECLARALEYNANVIIHFWSKASEASGR